MKTTGNLYKTLDFFMLRTPVLPIQEFSKCFPSSIKEGGDAREIALERLLELSRDPFIREALAASSPTLLESLVHISNHENPRKQGQVIKAFMRYIIRMITRPTPFGLLSGITYGRFGERSQLFLQGTDTFKKRARPDMEWLMKAVELVESRKEIVRQLRVRSNKLIYRQGNRAKIPYTTRHGSMNDGEDQSVSVRITQVFDCVMAASSAFIPFLDLVDHLNKTFESANIEVIERYVWQLFEQEFLISELIPPTTTTEPLSYIRSVLKPVTGIEELKEDLDTIADTSAKYNHLPIGQGEQLLESLRQKMNKMFSAKSSLQIDLSLEDRGIILPQSIRKDIECVAELLTKLSTRENRPLNEFCVEFLEKYGPYREVPLLDLLDEDTGLGAPAGYKHPMSRRVRLQDMSPSKSRSHQEKLLFQWFVSAMHEGKHEIVLTDNMIDELIKGHDTEKWLAAPSMELFFQLITSDQEALDQGEYTLLLAPNQGSDAAGKTFGRFMDLFGEPFNDIFSSIQSEEQRLQPGKLLAGISYLPSSGRSANVVLTKQTRPYEIAIGANHTMPEDRQIHISDLVVGVRNDHFYLKSKSRNREVIASSGHMLNAELTPNIYRFLVEVSDNSYRHWSPMEWGFVAHAPFTPRLRYKHIILYPGTWRIASSSSKKMADFAEEIRLFQEKWNIPRYVYMIESDNRILLDMDHPLHIEQICRDLQSKGKVTLIEHIGGLDNSPVSCEKGHLTAEFVCPLVRNQAEDTQHFVEETAASLELVAKENEQQPTKADYTYLPGESWFYAKLYGINSRQNEFIGGYWEEFVRKHQDNGTILQAYFIRYADPDKHLRVRFELSKNRTADGFLSTFHKWTEMLLHEGMIARVVIDTYEPEIERYGGSKPMAWAERMFSCDSEVTTKLVHLIRFNQVSLEEDIIATLSVINLLYQFGYHEKDAFNLLNRYFDVKEYLENFRKERKFFLQWFASDQEISQSIQSNLQAIESIFKIRREAVKQYSHVLYEHETGGLSTNTREDIVFSVIHMHLNRLLGIDRDRERKIMIMARHALNSLVQYRGNRQ
ncbi:lantibiotic dehydratase [Paenibacillus polymyxa]|uniref:lantibiotic dehydratase n=1 Tax=Paenibacillus polymyxa TaxID=1406 RepID=UPI002025353D|nr:lantibiotic dehydratase [Paenibacillus polymyxa]URJ36214.3 lantibiotic dehydratase [Paenibacillus polymyxa]